MFYLLFRKSVTTKFPIIASWKSRSWIGMIEYILEKKLIILCLYLEYFHLPLWFMVKYNLIKWTVEFQPAQLDILISNQYNWMTALQWTTQAGCLQHSGPCYPAAVSDSLNMEWDLQSLSPDGRFYLFLATGCHQLHFLTRNFTYFIGKVVVALWHVFWEFQLPVK
jgi:hypothetical protein